ncbi:MAG TPA: hypothetical protein VGE64_03875 [Xanthomonadaceae bacterium]
MSQNDDAQVMSLTQTILGELETRNRGACCTVQALLTATSCHIDRAIKRGDVQLMAVTAEALDMLAERARQMQLCAPPPAQNDAEAARAH